MVAQITTSPTQCVVVSSDPNGNHDSGYAPSNIEDAIAGTSTPPESPQQRKRTDSADIGVKRSILNKRNGINSSPKRENVRYVCVCDFLICIKKRNCTKTLNWLTIYAHNIFSLIFSAAWE